MPAMPQLRQTPRIARRPSLRRWRSAGALLAAAALLAGCAMFSPDAGMDAVSEIAGQELKKDVVAIRTPEDAAVARAAVARLLRRPLTADAAVQVALLNNRGLQAAFAELAVAEARRVGESLPPNPFFSLVRISSAVELEVERRIVADVLALATLPARSEIATTRFHQAQLRAAEETLRLAVATRRAYYRAVAARELAAFLAEAESAAEAASKIAARLGETGAMNKLDQAREQVFYAELTAQLAAARQRADSEREALVRAMGLWGSDLGFKLPAALPALPRRVQSLNAIEVEAVRRRVDLEIARMELAALARSYGLTQATRFINLLEGATPTSSSKTTRPARAPNFAASRSACRFRCSISARCACARPRRPTCWRSTACSSSRSTCARRRATPTGSIARPTTSPATTSARCCRCARSSPTRRCCATTPC